MSGWNKIFEIIVISRISCLNMMVIYRTIFGQRAKLKVKRKKKREIKNINLHNSYSFRNLRLLGMRKT